MRLKLIVVLFVILGSFVSYPYPHQLPLDLPIAESIGARGLTAYKLNGSFAGGSRLEIGRAISNCFDIWMNVSSDDLFCLHARALLVNRLGPINMSIDLSMNSFTLLSAFFLGPVQIDIGRVFGSEADRWILISASPNQWYSIACGLEFKTRNYPIAAVRLFPHRGIWGLSIYLRDREWGLCFGGILW